jgi:hypothetical protein
MIPTESACGATPGDAGDAAEAGSNQPGLTPTRRPTSDSSELNAVRLQGCRWRRRGRVRAEAAGDQGGHEVASAGSLRPAPTVTRMNPNRVSHQNRSRPASRWGSIGDLVAIDRSTWREAASSSAIWNPSSRPPPPAPAPPGGPGVAVVSAVELGHRGVQPSRRRWDEWDLERTSGHHHLPGPVSGIGDAKLEGAVLQPPELADTGVQPHRQLEGLGVVAKVVGHRVLGRVGAGRSRETPCRAARRTGPG